MAFHCISDIKKIQTTSSSKNGLFGSFFLSMLMYWKTVLMMASTCLSPWSVSCTVTNIRLNLAWRVVVTGLFPGPRTWPWRSSCAWQRCGGRAPSSSGGRQASPGHGGPTSYSSTWVEQGWVTQVLGKQVSWDQGYCFTWGQGYCLPARTCLIVLVIVF